MGGIGGMKTFLLCGLVGGVLLGGDDSHTKEVKDEMEKLKGTWTLVSCTVAGEEEKVQDSVLLLEIRLDGLITIIHHWPFSKRIKHDEGTLEIEPTENPKGYRETLQGQNAKPWFGVYELRGDTLRFCFLKDRRRKPSRIPERPTSEVSIVTYKRKQP
jgi:uncharacterized protein (TIGR03067 family)